MNSLRPPTQTLPSPPPTATAPLPVVRQITRPAGTIQERFEEFDRLNPWVLTRLTEMTRDWRRRGGRKVGIEMFFAVLRWQHGMATSDPSSDFKLNDHYTSRYARKIMTQNADLADVFETRQLKAR